MGDYFTSALEGDKPKEEVKQETPIVEEQIEVENKEDEKPVEEVKEEEVLSNTEEKKEEAKEEEKTEQPEFSDEDFWKLATEKVGREVKSTEDLTIFQDKEVEKEYRTDFAKNYEKYFYETGKSVESFMMFNRDLTQMDESEVIKESLKTQNSNLTQKEVDFMFKQKYSFNEDDFTEDEIMSKKINFKVDYNDALNKLQSDKDKYGVPSDNSLKSQEAKFKEQQVANEQNTKAWVETVASTNQNFNSIDIDLGENLKYKHNVDDKVKAFAKEVVSDNTMQKFLAQFQNDKGETDVLKMQELVYHWSNRNEIMREVAEQAATREREAITKEGKFINFKSDNKPVHETKTSKQQKENLELYRRSKGLN